MQVFRLHSEVEGRHWWFRARRRLLTDILAHVVPPSLETTVVDIGCGTGANTAYLAGRYRVVGMDVSPEAIRIARASFPEHSFWCGPADQLLVRYGIEPDIFLLWDVLEHVRDDFELLSSLLAISRPGSCFVLTVPADMKLWSKHDEAHGHFRRYDRYRFERLWDGLPVTPLLVSHFNSRLYPLVRFVRKMNKWRGVSFGREGTDLSLPPPPLNWLLECAFAGERYRLRSAMQNAKSVGYRRGASLLAVLQRSVGEIRPRSKPNNVAEDPFDAGAAGNEATRANAARVQPSSGGTRLESTSELD